jgi:flagellar basal body-associated protein FliL
MAEEEMNEEVQEGGEELTEKKPAIVKILVIVIVAVVLIGGTIITSYLISNNAKESKVKQGSQLDNDELGSGIGSRKDSLVVWNLIEGEPLHCNLLEGGNLSINGLALEWDSDDASMFGKQSPAAYLEANRIVFISKIKEFFNSKTMAEIKDTNNRDTLLDDLRRQINQILPTDKYVNITNVYIDMFYQER